MKRIFVLLLVVCLLLCACGATQETPGTTLAAPVETTAPTTEPTTEATEPPVLYRNPLTGRPIDSLYTARPTAIVINNIKACLPQFGISQADMIYEFETEGGITRLLAIFSDFSGIGSIGPVRSARTYFTNIAASYDLPLIHCGGSQAALKGNYSQNNTLSKWVHIDQRFNGSFFFRDTQRRKNGYAYEHTLFTTGEDMIKALEKKKMNTITESGVDYGLQFADDVTLNGESANKITVTFRGKKTTTLTYNADYGVYAASQYKQDHVDAGTNEILTYKNVLVLISKQTRAKDSNYTRSYYDLEGTGEGYFACNGQIVPIKWIRNKVSDNFSYTLADGTPLTLGVGTSYIGVVDDTAPAGVTAE